MKYAFNFLLIFLFCFTLASCGGGDDTVEPTPDPIDNTGGDDGSDDGGGDDGEDDGSDDGGEDDGEDDGTTEDPNPQDGAISPIPETFTHKVVIEEATGTWCGWCPMGTAIMDKYVAEYPNRVYGIAIHGGSPTEPMKNDGMINALDRVYDLAGFPSGLVNRIASPSTRELFIHPDNWSEAIDKQLEKSTTSVGIALESNINEADAIATVQAHVGFGQDVNTSTNYKILIYLIEDGIVSPQQNYLSGDSDFSGGNYNKYYEAPAVIDDYIHNHVAKRAFTSLDGEEIGAENVGEFKKFKKEFQINLTRSDNLTESYVVAVLLQDGSRPSVLNVQKVKLGETKDWD
ncbi:Omp28-related outer membrane protein [Bernardetia litoralis]|nr:Omp28-related outer membrane protein [Bernardetia litoralis]